MTSYNSFDLLRHAILDLLHETVSFRQKRLSFMMRVPLAILASILPLTARNRAPSSYSWRKQPSVVSSLPNFQNSQTSWQPCIVHRSVWINNYKISFSNLNFDDALFILVSLLCPKTPVKGFRVKKDIVRYLIMYEDIFHQNIYR